MKHPTSLVAIILGALLCLGFVGCKKKSSTGAAKTPEEAAFELRMALQKASPQVQNIYNDKVDNGVRYARYQDALTALEDLVAQPGVTEEQKKLANQLADVLKAKLATPTTPP